MQECEKLSVCPIWDSFQSDLKFIWINNYCRGPRQDRCARLVLARDQKPVPAKLLPNGTSIPG